MKSIQAFNMKLYITVIFVHFVYSATAFDMDITDNNTLEYLLTQMFDGGDPSKYQAIKAEIQQHTDDLMEGFLNLVGDGFQFDKNVKEKFNNEFDLDKLQSFVEGIFGIGSEIASQMKQNSSVIKQKLLDLIETLLGGSSASRRKRSFEVSSEKEESTILRNKSIVNNPKQKSDHQQADSSSDKKLFRIKDLANDIKNYYEYLGELFNMQKPSHKLRHANNGDGSKLTRFLNLYFKIDERKEGEDDGDKNGVQRGIKNKLIFKDNQSKRRFHDEALTNDKNKRFEALSELVKAKLTSSLESLHVKVGGIHNVKWLVKHLNFYFNDDESYKDGDDNEEDDGDIFQGIDFKDASEGKYEPAGTVYDNLFGEIENTNAKSSLYDLVKLFMHNIVGIRRTGEVKNTKYNGN